MLIRLFAAIELILLAFNFTLGWNGIDPWMKKEWLDQYMILIANMEPPFTSSVTFLVFDLFQMLFLLTSLLGVVLFTKRVRYFYLVAFLTSIPFVFLSPFYVVSSGIVFIDFVSAAISGALLTFLFTAAQEAEQGAAANP